jgi:membrane associated rhomboid family serine protease
MIPWDEPSRRTMRVPIITASIIGLNAMVFLVELAGGTSFVNRWSLVPAHILAGRGWITVLTSLFMHAGPVHILANMLFLWMLGPEIEEMMGPAPYLLLYVLGGLVALGLQVAIAPASTLPCLGTCGAVGAVMGAFLLTYPRKRNRTVLLFGWFVRLSLVVALALVGLWFLSGGFSQVGAVIETQSGAVAYAGLVGGFVLGMVAGRLLESRSRRAEQELEP